ncbi:hypothetical protein XENTR_v10019776 [Xenopus tropicalis]|uniref:Uncharacterized protein LOC101734515 n=2 Tax=Xenopus tropicalis TaxID=8364 RepID=A0A8J1JVM6_XENTR|nr:uncharacterized protein LOC101734515 [Xenopus tropicalis]KAE8594738.1 hypothetical protein XENTR_v10019776 [Xenopus tropicalis]
MFLVVEFIETNTVNIISESWLEDGVTWWPNYRSDERINRAVQKCEEPGADWKKYDVRVHSRTGDYLKARQKLRALLTCNTSELQTDEEEEVIRKRKIKPRQIFGDTDSDSEPEMAIKRRCHNVLPCPVPPIPPPTPDNEACQTTARPLLDQRQTESYFTAAPPAPLSTSCMPSSPLPHSSVGHFDTMHFQDDFCSGPQVATRVSHTPSSSMGQISATPLPDEHFFRPTFRLGKTGTGPIPCSAAQLHILTLLDYVKEQQTAIAAAVNNLAARLGTEAPVAEMPKDISIPLTTVPEVEEFEEWLKDSRNSQAKQNMISALGAVGGQNTKRVTWNILSRLYSDAVAKQINWKGVNGKKCFKEMLRRSLLIRAVRKNQSSTNAADSEIDSYAIRWFNLAPDRGGGRKERSRVKEALTEMAHGN